MEQPPRDVIVVGAGISGLSAAFWLARGGRRVTVLEAGPRVGGSITSATVGGYRFELGPNTVLANHPSVDELIAAAGLAGRRLEARPEAKRRYLWKGGRLLALPGGPGGAITTPLLSLGGKLRVLLEPFLRPRREAGDESIADFVRRRLGGEMLDWAVGPFVSGVYAGDAERLAVRWATAKIHRLEVEHGSLIRGALAKRKGPAPSGAMFSFADGLGELPETLAAAIGDVRTDQPVRRVVREGNRLRVDTAGQSFVAPQVILAVPADVVAALLDEATAGRSRPFAELPYAAVAVVCLGVRREQVSHPLGGFGFLAPRKADLRLLGCLFPSEFFRGRAPAGGLALTAIAGGRTDPEVVAWDDQRLLALVREELGRAIGLSGDPETVLIRRWPRAIPQYELGHGRFVELAGALEAALPGLHIAGNVVGGVSVADCVKNGTALARSLLSG